MALHLVRALKYKDTLILSHTHTHTHRCTCMHARTHTHTHTTNTYISGDGLVKRQISMLLLTCISWTTDTHQTTDTCQIYLASAG